MTLSLTTNFQNDVDCSDERDLNSQASRTIWRPVLPPTPGEPLAPFYISLLLPGLSTSFLQTVLRRSYNTVRKYKAQAREASVSDPAIMQGVHELMAGLSPSDGLAMALVRGRCQLPFWSRIAIAEYVKAGSTISSVSAAFRCSSRTVSNIIHRSVFLNPDRVLAAQQLNPPGRFLPRSGVQRPPPSKKIEVLPGSTATKLLHRDSRTPKSTSDPTGGCNLQPGLTIKPSTEETTRG